MITLKIKNTTTNCNYRYDCDDCVLMLFIMPASRSQYGPTFLECSYILNLLKCLVRWFSIWNKEEKKRLKTNIVQNLKCLWMQCNSYKKGGWGFSPSQSLIMFLMTNHGYRVNLIKHYDVMYIYLHIRLLVNISMYVFDLFQSRWNDSRSIEINNR